MARIRRKRYSDAFKLEAVRLVQTSERPLTEFAEHLGVTATTLHAWVRQHRPPAPERLTGDERRELEQLRRENARLRMERDILKSRGLLRERDESVPCRFIAAEKARVPIRPMCQTLGVSPSGYDAWVARQATPRPARDLALRHAIRVAS